MLNITECLSDVHRQGWGVVRCVALDANNAALLALGAQLGIISKQGLRPGAPNLENDGVNRVESMDHPMRDAIGNAVLSSNADEFALHTDDSYSPAPARYVLMHCWQSDASGGGQSWLAYVDEVVRIAPADLIERLSRQLYVTPFGHATVLRQDAQGIDPQHDQIPRHMRYQMRFNRRDMIGFAKLRYSQISAQHVQDLEAFEALAMQVVQRVSLQSGDCILVDNLHCLHGRSAFDASSNRLIKRLRIA